MVESEGSNQHPKRSKLTNHSQFPSTSMQHSSFNRVPILPSEFITEILLKLPMKSLVRFRCISQSWLALISSPEFVKTLLSIFANNKEYTHHKLILSSFRRGNINDCSLKDCSLSSLLYDSIAHSFDLDYPMKHLRQSIKVVGSVNGLICLAIEDEDFILWNPSIRKFKKLPDSRAAGCYFIYGFGYDELQNDYKLVGISGTLNYRRSHKVETKIYSLQGNSFRSIRTFQTGLLSDIISIDLIDGKWGKVEKPCYREGDFDFTMQPGLGVMGSDLSMYCRSRRTRTDFWIMKEYGVKDSWTKVFTFNYPHDNPTGHLFSPPFIMSSKGDILFRFGSAFVIYNPKDDSFKNQKVTNCNIFWHANIYIESLVWPFWQKEPVMQQRKLKKLRRKRSGKSN
ncbi:F-box/kelch-repeat protein At3g23880-like [Lycium ferocissimum]|uniref:F-box/kelch-repeat protein At3g23880-like n=1 Tax=Lycium ferocissimum TaxID=112874 RepID=UPI0028157499|nr:F-box/kelch-repeat protein At3g23880-like [Lycium ferocissimum]